MHGLKELIQIAPEKEAVFKFSSQNSKEHRKISDQTTLKTDQP